METSLREMQVVDPLRRAGHPHAGGDRVPAQADGATIGGRPILWHIMKLLRAPRLTRLRPLPRLQGRHDQATTSSNYRRVSSDVTVDARQPARVARPRRRTTRATGASRWPTPARTTHDRRPHQARRAATSTASSFMRHLRRRRGRRRPRARWSRSTAATASWPRVTGVRPPGALRRAALDRRRRGPSVRTRSRRRRAAGSTAASSSSSARPRLPRRRRRASSSSEPLERLAARGQLRRTSTTASGSAWTRCATYSSSNDHLGERARRRGRSGVNATMRARAARWRDAARVLRHRPHRLQGRLARAVAHTSSARRSPASRCAPRHDSDRTSSAAAWPTAADAPSATSATRRRAARRFARRPSPTRVSPGRAAARARVATTSPLETFEINVIGTAHLLEALRAGRRRARGRHRHQRQVLREPRVGLGLSRRRSARRPRSVQRLARRRAELVRASYRRSFFRDARRRHGAAARARAGNVIGGGDWARDRLVPDVHPALLARREPIPCGTRVVAPVAARARAARRYLLLGQRLWQGRHRRVPGAWNFGPAAEGVPHRRGGGARPARAAWPALRYRVERPDSAPHEAVQP